MPRVLFAYKAEVKAIHHALLFCQQFLCSNVLIEGDSLIAIGWVNNKQNRPLRLMSDLNI